MHAYSFISTSLGTSSKYCIGHIKLMNGNCCVKIVFQGNNMYRGGGHSKFSIQGWYIYLASLCCLGITNQGTEKNGSYM